jgi:hypothetical protein
VAHRHVIDCDYCPATFNGSRREAESAGWSHLGRNNKDRCPDCRVRIKASLRDVWRAKSRAYRARMRAAQNKPEPRPVPRTIDDHEIRARLERLRNGLRPEVSA